MTEQDQFDAATREAARALLAFRQVYASCQWWIGRKKK